MSLNQVVLDELMFKLKKVKYKNILREIKLEHCTDNDGDYIHLICINIKKSQRNKGYGSVVLSEVIQLADKYSVRIKLWVTDVFGSELKRLYGFYRRFRFILIKTENDGNMLYIPSKIKKKL